MGDTGAHIDVTDGQIEQVNLVRWLLSPNTKATQSKARMKSPSKKQNGLNEMTTESSGNVAPATETTAATTIKPVKIISCIQCQSRKIKCDKVKPACGHCIKSKIGFCEYRPPATPRRGKRKLTEADLLLRLRGHEDLLRDSGFEIDEDGNVNRATRPSVSQGDAKPPIKKRHTLRESSNGTNTSTADLSIKCDGRSTGEIIVEEDGSRYVESDLWRGIGAMTQQTDTQNLSQLKTLPEEIALDNSDPNSGDFLFEQRGSRASLASFHPSAADKVMLWDAFINNVDPLLKILHIPTFENEMWEATRNTETIPSGMEALMFAIYTISVASMPAAECEKSFGIAKSILFARFESAVKKAFVKAGILVSTDFRLVQAIVIWLHSIRDTYHPHALWILSGVALRISQRAGIHREKALANFSAFEAEIRRRTWWALMSIDSRAAEISGSGISVFHNAHDTEMPRNLNDSDLTPSMTELPPSRTGATEMMFVSLRHEVSKLCKDNLNAASNSNGTSSYPRLTDRKIEEFEQLLEHKFLRFCDALYPLHYITSIVGRACIGMMRLIMHHPCQYPNGASDMTEEEKYLLLQLCLKSVRYQHLINSTPALASRYLWHCDAYFPWHAFIYVITTICKTGDKKQAIESWDLVHKTFDIYPKMINDTRKPLHVALGNLIIKAWDATGHWVSEDKAARTVRPALLTSTKQYPPSSFFPDFISKLQAQRAPQSVQRSVVQHNGTASIPANPIRLAQPTAPGILAQTPTYHNSTSKESTISPNYSGSMMLDIPEFESFDISPEAWAEWDRLLANSQTMDISSEFQDPGSWSMYGGFD